MLSVRHAVIVSMLVATTACSHQTPPVASEATTVAATAATTAVPATATLKHTFVKGEKFVYRLKDNWKSSARAFPGGPVPAPPPNFPEGMLVAIRVADVSGRKIRFDEVRSGRMIHGTNVHSEECDRASLFCSIIYNGKALPAYFKGSFFWGPTAFGSPPAKVAVGSKWTYVTTGGGPTMVYSVTDIRGKDVALSFKGTMHVVFPSPFAPPAGTTTTYRGSALVRDGLIVTRHEEVSTQTSHAVHDVQLISP